MSVEKLEKLTFKKAVAIGERIRPLAYLSGEDVELPSVNDISKELGIHLTSVKRWIAEAVFVASMPTPVFRTHKFVPSEAEPIEVLAFYIYSRLGETWMRSSAAEEMAAAD